MAFQINTNINALNAHAQGVGTQLGLKNSLEKLSSGLRINKAADDASGMIIADSLRSQASALGQAISNTNDGMGIIQIADKAMDEMLKILDTVKVKATQAAQDGQTTASRKAIQNDIIRLVQGLDYIGNTTSYNGQALLSGQWTNKEFQVGAYSNQSIKASIGSTTSDKIGQVRLETGAMITAAGEVSLKFLAVDGVNDVQLETVKISHSSGTGLGNLAEVINKSSDKTGIRAQAVVLSTSDEEVKAGDLRGIVINGFTIGDVLGIKQADSDGRLVQAFNTATSETGVEAYIDNAGRLNLRSTDGRGIAITADNGQQAGGGGQGQNTGLAIEKINGQTLQGTTTNNVPNGGSVNYGRLSLTRLDARDIIVSGTNISATGYGQGQKVAEWVSNLRDVLGVFNEAVRSAAGGNENNAIATANQILGAGVTTLRGAMVVMDIAESATKTLDRIRADLGSVQGQMLSTVNNITITQVNVKAAESQIREVDFASESAEFNKLSILAQSGSYAMSQANAAQQNILRLLS
ncbi:flagellin B [Helicobacter sp. CLO-3]|uniref:flagellin A n=1 Tax=unclassified Helicobacter TaxID=2593540 RepID=UPI000805F04A|nr:MULTISPECIES: flagellin A [unclassified Helicobacter]OBV28614.1 flagellin B [Helicobacter sp. CLO-3]OHU82505.1 flagellin B [Helicobacter sp. CLO-3]